LNVRIAVLALVGLAFLSVGAQAQGTACFDWSCDSSTGICSFNSGCSTITSPGFLWRYSWTFGDGNSDLTGSNLTSNDYSGGPGCYYPWVKLTVIPFNTNPFSVECQITVWECVGPPQGTSGRCSN
jgi:hypothetical protein